MAESTKCLTVKLSMQGLGFNPRDQHHSSLSVLGPSPPRASNQTTSTWSSLETHYKIVWLKVWNIFLFYLINI